MGFLAPSRNFERSSTLKNTQRENPYHIAMPVFIITDTILDYFVRMSVLFSS